MTTYNLDPASARQAGVNTRISEKGAYVGTFTRAEAVAAKSGSTGIEFTFRTQDGRTADYLSVWAAGADGEKLSGKRMIDAIMACTATRTMTAQMTPVKKRTKDGEQDAQVPCFRELMNKPIGLMLVVEEYQKNDGSVGTKMVIAAPFCATTKRTAAEILDKAPEARTFDAMLAALQDRSLKANSRRSAAPATSRSPQTASGTGFDDMDDDIPF